MTQRSTQDKDVLFGTSSVSETSKDGRSLPQLARNVSWAIMPQVLVARCAQDGLHLIDLGLLARDDVLTELLDLRIAY